MILQSETLAKTYRWVDENGKVHYSQSIPPSASQRGHTELSASQGIVVKEVESQEERKERVRKSKEKKENKEATEAALREELLIHMFANEEDLKAHFQERIRMIGTNIRLLQSNKKKMKTETAELQTRLMRTKDKATRESLTTLIRDIQGNMLEHTQAIETNQQEQTETRVNMDRSLVKFRKKKAEGRVSELGSLIGSNSQILNGSGGCNCPCQNQTQDKK